jgi:hypothetical protein
MSPLGGVSPADVVRTLLATMCIGALAARAAWDLARRPRDPRRAKEYAFLLLTTVAATLYAVAHDEVTVTISPEYFLVGKGLADDPRPLRVAVTLLAIRSSWWVGLAGGAVLLLANNPRAGGPPQLPYGLLVRAALTAPTCAAVVACVLGLLTYAMAADALAAVRMVHLGSYSGGAVGTVLAVAQVLRRRRNGV